MKFFLMIILTAISASSFAMPNPQNVALSNTAEFGKFVQNNAQEIIDTSVELAEKAIPNSHYFLVTHSISITPFDVDVEQSKKPFATLAMSDGPLECNRDVYLSVKTDQWGENRKLTFSLSPEIRCTQK